MNYQDVSLRTIRQNPRNPRKIYEGRNFDELVASIAVKGVIQPIVIRPVKESKEGTIFEVVAGNRRFMASAKLSAARKMPTATIPAVIRDLSDGEAFEFMMIENLQREDLTDLEEAQSFKGFIESRKKEGTNGSAIDELGKRIGLNPRYIRSRIDVLSLPKYALKEWDKGTLSYGHLRQLLRITDTKALRDTFDWIFEDFRHDDAINTVSNLKEEIDGESPELKFATFDQTQCKICSKNSAVQIVLWDIGDAKNMMCHDPKCFIKKQGKSLKDNWEKSEFRLNYKTNGFRFEKDLDWNEWERFYEYPSAFRPDKECKKCANFVTLLSIFGKVEEKQVCLDKSCFTKKQRAFQTTGKPGEKAAAAGPRVSWHGEFFREEFLTERLPGKFAEHAPLADDESIRLAMFGFVSTSHHFKSLLAEQMEEQKKIKDNFSLFYVEGNVRLWQLIEKMNMGEVKAWLVKFAEDIILNRSEVSADARLKIAEFLGVKLLKEFSVTEEYLKKKTIKEMIEFGKKSKLFAEPKMMVYIVDKIKKKTFEQCKKTELISCFMKSGVDLVGRIPEEIIPAKK
jgi:ParB/RepB/Spo0J family partition protein